MIDLDLIIFMVADDVYAQSFEVNFAIEKNILIYFLNKKVNEIAMLKNDYRLSPVIKNFFITSQHLDYPFK